ncbi:VOC family protein [Tsukamurella tyrosinosolvens]|uniref:VOC family protein n=1 Tax=Tsukamurella tyrosinosolvens TaxID=57704 RepID=UPI0036C1B912
MNLNYLVIYRSDPAASAEWYADALALRFTREQHGGGPVHYAATLDDGTVVELYSAGSRPVTRTRIGLSVPDPYDVRPEASVITDPDGNTIAIEARAASA